MTIFDTISFILLAILTLVVLAVIIVTLKYYTWFHWRQCKYCGHNMEYKGLKDDDKEGHYLFHCPKCGSWEQVKHEEFVKECDKDFNPNSNQAWRNL